MTFFSLTTPRDMLNKARREIARLRHEPSIDHVFNFFVTANHILDYVAKTAAVPSATLAALQASEPLKLCRDVCDKAKHMRLTRRPDRRTTHRSGMIGAGHVGEFMIGGGEEWLLDVDGKEVDILELSETVLGAWEQFFREHAL